MKVLGTAVGGLLATLVMSLVMALAIHSERAGAETPASPCVTSYTVDGRVWCLMTDEAAKVEVADSLPSGMVWTSSAYHEGGG